MHIISITLLSVFLTAVSFAEQDQQLVVAGLSFPSNILPSAQVSDEFTTISLPEHEAMKQNRQPLRERDVTFGWYSHHYNLNQVYQWVFGNATTHFNISISTCVSKSDVAGIYQFTNGSTSTDATVEDIYMDLGYGTPLAIPDKRKSQTSINAEAAYNDISIFLLNSILCSGNSPLKDDLRGQILFRTDGFESRNQVMALISQSAGGMIAYFTWNATDLPFDDHPGVKMLFGGIATLNLILILGVLEIFRQEGAIAHYETAFVATVFAARARSLVLRATQTGPAGQATEACLTGTQLAAAAAYAGSGSAPAPGLGVVASAEIPEILATACSN